MAALKIVGLEVTPRSESSSTRRRSSPDSISWRPIWSSHTLVPAAVRAARFSLICCVAMSSLLESVDHRAAGLGDALGGEAEVAEEVLGRGAGPERGHADHLAVAAGPAMPAERAQRLDRDAGARLRRQHLVPVGLVLLLEAVHARHGHEARGDALVLEQRGGAVAEVHFGAARDEDEVGRL